MIDVFYRIKALYACGVEITLHCFQYGDRTPQVELEKYCKTVYYYQRGKLSWKINIPYIVSTRANNELLNNLLKDEAPILFEALHSCYLLNHDLLKGRKKMVRMHNIEHDYYALLAKNEGNIGKRIYYYLESVLLERYENVLRQADVIFAISPKDQKDLQNRFGSARVQLLPAFHGNEQVSSMPGKGDFCFYHGKLSVAENHSAAMYLVNEVFTKTPAKLLIAGDGVSESLKRAVRGKVNIEIKEDLGVFEIDKYMQEAHINVLPTFQPTGIKLKLINVLFKGRYLLVNNHMVDQTGLEEATVIASDAADMAKKIDILMQQNFGQTEIEKRKTVIGQQFDVSLNAGIILKHLD